MNGGNDRPQKRVLVPIAHGSIETEIASFHTCLAKANAQVVTACIDGDIHRVCQMCFGTKMQADITLQQAVNQEWDLIILPGGEDACKKMRYCHALIALLQKQQQQGRLYAASGAAPAIVLAPHHLVEPGATCYPLKRYRDMIPNARDDDVVIQDEVVTSQGVGSALVFSLVLVEQLYGKRLADKIAQSIMVDRTGQIGFRYWPTSSVPLYHESILFPNQEEASTVVATASTSTAAAPVLEDDSSVEVLSGNDEPYWDHEENKKRKQQEEGEKPLAPVKRAFGSGVKEVEKPDSIL